MPTVVEDLKSLSDQHLRERLDALSAAIDRGHEAGRGRPRADAEFLRRQLYVPTARRDLQQAQEAWDLANPEAAAAWKFIDELELQARDLSDELDRRARQREERARVLSVLDDAPRLRATVEKGLAATPAHDAVQEWERAKSWCLLLLGGVGCGKSTAAAAFAVRFGEGGGKACWVRAVEASRMSAFGADAEARFAAWRSVGCLVLDDLGTELMTPTWQQALDDVLDYRYQHSLRTLLPTNLTADEFKARYGDRISDRIRHDGTVRVLSAPSLRKRGAA